MILRSVKLENIRSYEHEVIEFPEGSVLLSGDIGSGKSTILLAIEFALFGIMRAGLSGSSLLRHGKNNGSVELKFEVDKNKYVIKRTLKRTKTSVTQDSGYLLTNDRKFEGTPVELKAKIIQILGYPEELITRSKSLIYRYTVYTPQEEMKQILFEDKDTRLDTLRKIFGIDKYKTIKENVVLSIRDLKRKQSELKIRLESYDELNNEKKDNKNHIQNLSQDILKKSVEQEENKKKLASEKFKLNVFEEDIKKYNDLKKNLEVKEAHISGKKSNKNTLEKRILETKDKIQSFEEKLILYEKITELKEEKVLEESTTTLQDKLSVIIKEKSAKNEKLYLIKEQLTSLENEIKTLTKSSKDAIVLEAKLSNLNLKLQKKPEQESLLREMWEKEKKVYAKSEKINLQIKESKEIIDDIKDADVCPTCRQEVDEQHKKTVTEREFEKIKQYQKEKNKFTELLEKISSNLDKIRNNLDKLSGYEKQYNQIKEQLISLKTSSDILIKKQKELSSLFARKTIIEESDKDYESEDKLQKQINKEKNILSSVRDNNLKYREKKNITELIFQEKKNLENLDIELNKVNQELFSLENEKIVLQESVDKYKETSDKYEKQKSVLDELKEQQKNVEINLAALNQEKKTITEHISNLEQKIKDLEKIKTKIKELNEIQNWLDTFFLKLMSNMEKHIMVSIHKEFNSLLKEWFSILIDDIDLNLDEEFSVKIIQDGYETSVESLSGGEKTSIALAYRLALNKVINDLISVIKTKDLIILDEPTDGFSTEQLDRVRDVLAQLNMKQTIIVSHEPKMESYVENIIRISKTDNLSRIS